MFVRPMLMFSAVALAGALTLASPAAHATTVTDPIGDVLNGFDAAAHADLDVVSASGTYNATHLFLSSTQNGAVGISVGNLYVWGVDRGQGQDTILAHSPGQPSLGNGVKFDAFITFDSTGTQDHLFRVTYNPDKSVASVVEGLFSSSWVTIDGNTISVAIPLSELASTGFDVAHYGLNVWPRLGDTSTTAHIVDFAPNGLEQDRYGNPLFNPSAVPEPTSWALMIMGFGLAGATLRRRRSAAWAA
ncbi:MAG: PEPxxWA-CTERM sorting domain-containing protein [Phenylobacterium sp.]